MMTLDELKQENANLQDRVAQLGAFLKLVQFDFGKMQDGGSIPPMSTTNPLP